MTKEELFQSLGKLAFAKVSGSFNPESEEITDDKVKEFTSAVSSLLTKDQAVSTTEIRNSVMGKTFAGMEEAIKAIIANDPMRKFDSELLEQIFSEKGKTSDKFYQIFKAQSAAYESDLAELKNKSGESQAGQEVLKREFENRGKLLEEKIKALEELEAKVSEKDSQLRQEVVRNYAALQMQGIKLNAPNDTVKEALQGVIYNQILNGADFDIQTDALGNRSISPLTKGSSEPIYDTKSSQPLSMQQYIEKIVAPFASFSEEPTKVVVSKDPEIDSLKSTPKSERERQVQETIAQAMQNASIPS